MGFLIRMSKEHGIRLKKKFGQNFLRDTAIIDNIVDNVVNNTSQDHTKSLFEIGCGDGVFTKLFLERIKLDRLWVFEIDPEWAEHVQSTVKNNALKVHQVNFLDIDLEETLQGYAPWSVYSSLPYHITFPILHKLQKIRHLLSHGCFIMQEEVAQKILKKSGRGYGYPALFFQRYFTWELGVKIPPTAFVPAPQVNSRVMYCTPIQNPVEIPDEAGFWKFIKICFHQPRRTLRNNISQSHYDITIIQEEILNKRAQELSMADLLSIWALLI